MPYRFQLADGVQPLEQILNKVGNPALVKVRQMAFQIVYSAPDTTISPREREVMRFPFTAMAGCPVCNSARLWRDYPGFSDEPIEEALYENALNFNFNWPGFSTRERLLLEFVDRFANRIEELNGDDNYWKELQAHFSESEIGDVVVMCGIWFGFGRGLKALGIGSSCEIATDGLLSRLNIGVDESAMAVRGAPTPATGRAGSSSREPFRESEATATGR